MNDDEYYRARDDRLLRYPGARRLDQERWIVIQAAPDYLRSFAGQVALLTATNLLGRMTRRIALAIPRTPMLPQLARSGGDLAEFALMQMRMADARGEYLIRSAQGADHVVFLGASGAPIVTHGAGWLAYTGPAPSPLPADDSANPVGAALAAICAAAGLAARGFGAPSSTVLLNSFNWSDGLEFSRSLPSLPAAMNLGTLWAVGAGSVGTAILYFLTLATRNFSALLFDGDRVKSENITRSPLFSYADIGSFKAQVTHRFLQNCGVVNVDYEQAMLHETSTWTNRAAGTPDIVVSAANEYNVRYLIESLLPPLQIYGTTGRNWQASVIRHVPMIDPCSCCLFPEASYTPTGCATDPAVDLDDDPQIDASLPHLSFAAGLMAAAEILKLSAFGCSMTANRTVLYTNPDLRLVTAGVPLRRGCLCEARSGTAHQKMITGSRYADLSRVVNL